MIRAQALDLDAFVALTRVLYAPDNRS
jgi:hypothetical protein